MISVFIFYRVLKKKEKLRESVWKIESQEIEKNQGMELREEGDIGREIEDREKQREREKVREGEGKSQGVNFRMQFMQKELEEM